MKWICEKSEWSNGLSHIHTSTDTALKWEDSVYFLSYCFHFLCTCRPHAADAANTWQTLPFQEIYIFTDMVICISQRMIRVMINAQMRMCDYSSDQMKGNAAKSLQDISHKHRAEEIKAIWSVGDDRGRRTYNVGRTTC